MNASEWNEHELSPIRKAVLAPSSHNMQPGFFQISKSAIVCRPDARLAEGL